jgi:hypothetical protein
VIITVFVNDKHGRRRFGSGLLESIDANPLCLDIMME